MVEANEQYAYFSVSGDFDPAAITVRVGVEPTEHWRRGDVCPRRQLERKSSRWSLYSRLGRNEQLETHVYDVLSQLDVHAEAFAAVSRELNAVMQLVGYFHVGYPGLSFEQSMIAGLARYALAVDFDFYWLHSDRREDT